MRINLRDLLCYPDMEQSQNASSLNEAYQDHDDCNDKKYVDKPPHGVGGY